MKAESWFLVESVDAQIVFVVVGEHDSQRQAKKFIISQPRNFSTPMFRKTKSNNRLTLVLNISVRKAYKAESLALWGRNLPVSRSALFNILESNLKKLERRAAPTRMCFKRSRWNRLLASSHGI